MSPYQGGGNIGGCGGGVSPLVGDGGGGLYLGVEVRWRVTVATLLPRTLPLYVIHTHCYAVVDGVYRDAVGRVHVATLGVGAGARAPLKLATYLKIDGRILGRVRHYRRVEGGGATCPRVSVDGTGAGHRDTGRGRNELRLGRKTQRRSKVRNNGRSSRTHACTHRNTTVMSG